MMLIKDVKKLSMFERLVYFLVERETIRLKKESGHPHPLTSDPILTKYKFCNVNRRDDRVSRWLNENWYHKHFDHPNMILACTIARQLNNPESLEAIGFPLKWDPKRVEAILNKRAARGLKNFSGAYMITGTLGGTKVQQVVWKVVEPMAKTRPKLDTMSVERSVQALLSYAGFSRFISGQVVFDMVEGVSGLWGDRFQWAPIGPGSHRGANRLLGRPLGSPMKQAEFNGFLASLIEKVKSKLNSIGFSTPSIEKMDGISWQSCLCELDKYSRVIDGMGKPKQLYRGGDV